VKRGRLRFNDPDCGIATSRPRRLRPRCSSLRHVLRRLAIVVQVSRFRRQAGESHVKSAADGLEHSRGMGPNVGGNRRAALMRAEDQRVCRRVRLTVRLGPTGSLRELHDCKRAEADALGRRGTMFVVVGEWRPRLPERVDPRKVTPRPTRATSV
jgi:hypothetical protein